MPDLAKLLVVHDEATATTKENLRSTCGLDKSTQGFTSIVPYSGKEDYCESNSRPTHR